MVILGSFLLLVDVANVNQHKTTDWNADAFRIVFNRNPLMSKVETVVVSEVKDRVIKGVLAADNDDGTSQFMRFDLALP